MFAFALPPQLSRAAEGASEHSLKVGSETRTYLVFRPDGAPNGPMPTVIALHGAMQSSSSFRGYFGMDEAAQKHGFAVVYPQGFGRVWNDGRPPAMRLKWVLRPGDDVAYMLALAQHLVDEGLADPSRLYLVGISNGGFMTQRMACEHAGRFAAYGVVMATTPANYREQCRPSRPVPIVFIHGTADAVVTYNGFWTPVGQTLSAPDSAAFFAALDGCTQSARTTLPDLDRFDGTDVELTRWSGCRPGSGVSFFKVERGGHQSPARVETVPDLATPFLGLRSHDIDSAEEIWRFISQFSLPQAAPAGALQLPTVQVPGQGGAGQGGAGQGGTGQNGTSGRKAPLPTASPLRESSKPAPTQGRAEVQRGMSAQ